MAQGRSPGRLPQIQIRVSQEIIDEMEALIPVVQAHPNHRASRVTLQDVARLALSRGIDVLKRENAGQE